MARTMKAAVVREFGKPLVIEEMAIPEPAPGQIQVKRDALELAGGGRVKATVTADKVENINKIFHKMHQGEIEGRIVLDMTA